MSVFQTSAKDSDAQTAAKRDSDAQPGRKSRFCAICEDTRILVAAPPTFGLVLRLSNPLIKQEVQYMKIVGGILFVSATLNRGSSASGK